jgi:SAM-dependent methyltransferase
MKPQDVIKLYGPEYVRTYDEKFLHSDLARQDAEFEYETLKKLLDEPTEGPPRTWLDVACGTGYFLSRFPHIKREGLDLSPAMIERARERNPGIPLHQGNVLDLRPQWEDKWDVVSCMWYAYTLLDTVAQVKQLIENLATWTSVRGACFLPLCDPSLVAGVSLPYQPQSLWPGQIVITGITWSYIEGPSERHENLIAPQLPYLVEMFDKHFETIEIIPYPGVRRAIIARGKRSR